LHQRLPSSAAFIGGLKVPCLQCGRNEVPNAPRGRKDIILPSINPAARAELIRTSFAEAAGEVDGYPVAATSSIGMAGGI
jgi:hypothetical protein